MSQSSEACLCCKALWIEFILCEDLPYTQDKACARVHDYWQGELPPSSQCNSTDCKSTCDTAGIGNSQMPAVCVYNQEADESGATYIFGGVKGHKGLAVYDDIEDKYRIVAIAPQDKAGFICFTLLEDQQGLAGTSATIQMSWGTQEDIQPPPSGGFKVYFCPGMFPHALANAKGIASYDAKDDKYWVVQCNQMVPYFRAKLGADMCPDEDATIKSQSAEQMTFFPFGQLIEPPAAKNRFCLAGESDDEILVAWSEEAGEWIVVQVKHKEIKVAVGIRYTNCEIQLGMRKVAVMYCDPTTEWGCVDTQIDPNGDNYCIELVEKNFITGLSQEDTTSGTGEEACRLKAEVTPVCVFEEETPPSPTEQVILDFTPIDVVVDVYDGGDGVMEVSQKIYVACVGESEEEEIFGWTDCDEGSSSGSGS